jgi:hypothetical protein
MTLKFYTDTHIDKQVAIQLRQSGVEVVRCEEVGMAEAKDEEHLNYAAQNGLSLISKDDDFIRLHVKWQQSNQIHYGVFFCPYRDRPSIGLIVEACLYYAEAIRTEAGTIEADMMNQLFYVT